MGAIAEAMANFARPLLDATDGSMDQMNRALMIGQLCWNLAVTPEARRDDFLAAMRPSLNMDDDEFESFRREVVRPMIRRHEEMFPGLHRLTEIKPASIPPVTLNPPKHPARGGKFPGTGRYDPCPCNSGRKYKFCCGRP